MLKKTFDYIDYNGNPRKEEHYFHLTQAEVTELELSVDGGLTEMIRRVVAAQNGRQIVDTMKDIIIKSYGVKSPDGRRFIKNQEVRDAFVQTEAYSQLFMELATNAKAASDFVAGIIPAKADEASADKGADLPAGTSELTLV
ncbi:hypothetical protein [Pseudoflavonifractor sp. 524-17]|uniref:hypothetical protein n=1 Tax=Pseudoflavonifractor sp. 524-17 TaxID=2304577 RepID=UPI001FAB3B00|nr:hypothetical protein [Pseudoflavonifractor sp. 524-17]